MLCSVGVALLSAGVVCIAVCCVVNELLFEQQTKLVVNKLTRDFMAKRVCICVCKRRKKCRDRVSEWVRYGEYKVKASWLVISVGGTLGNGFLFRNSEGVDTESSRRVFLIL